MPQGSPESLMSLPRRQCPRSASCVQPDKLYDGSVSNGCKRIHAASVLLRGRRKAEHGHPAFPRVATLAPMASVSHSLDTRYGHAEGATVLGHRFRWGGTRRAGAATPAFLG